MDSLHVIVKRQGYVPRARKTPARMRAGVGEILDCLTHSYDRGCESS